MIEKQRKTRNPKFETILNDPNAQSSKQARFGFRFSDFEFECCGLFRISRFGFRILIRDRVASWRDELC